jgi:Ca2+-binding EF-hand superfamily protein
MQTRTVDPAKLQQKLFAKLDTNGDQSIDKSELKSFMDFVSTQTGTSTSGTSTTGTSAASSTDALFSALDSDGDGSITSTELADNGKALFDQLRDQLRNVQLSSSDAPPPPPPPRDDESSGTQDGMQIGRMLASLLQQYSAVNSTTASSSATQALSVAA